jgi:hypothetical protein
VRLDRSIVAAWQGALAAEQQAAFGYALLGPHLGADRRNLARSCQAIHEQLRDDTADAIAAVGVYPGAPQGDYPQLYGVASLILAAQLEDDCAAAWRFFYAALAAGAPNPRLRADAQRGLTASAVRATRWRMLGHASRPVVAFPGTAAQK